MLVHFRKISLFMAYTIATIPLWHYIRETHILLLMLAVIAFAYLNVLLSSADLAQSILSSEKSKSPLPRWLPKKPKYEKSWLIVHYTLKWHLLLIPAKMGLALGFTQWLRTGPGITESILRPYIYNSSTDPSYPLWELFFLGLITIIVFTILEAILTASIITLTPKFSRQIALRFMIALSLIGVASQIDTFSEKPISEEEAEFFFACRPNIDGGSICYSTPRAATRLLYMRIDETIITALFPTTDMGLLLSANIMRPSPYIAGYPGTEIINYPFVLRQCLAAILGIFLYLGTTWLILCFVEDEPEPHPIAS